MCVSNKESNFSEHKRFDRKFSQQILSLTYKKFYSVSCLSYSSDRVFQMTWVLLNLKTYRRCFYDLLVVLLNSDPFIL